MKPYPKYKDSGVEWLGSVPAHWIIARNITFVREHSALSQYGEEQLLSVSEYYGVRPTAEKKAADEHLSRADSLVGYRIVKQDELVMNYMLAWKGALGISKFEGIVSPAYSVFKLRKDTNPDYFHYLWRTPVAASEFKRLSTGIIESRLRLYPDVFLKEVYSPLPPLDEQRAIAAYLDRETAKIDNLIAKYEQLIALLEEKRQALISHAVTKGIDSLRSQGFKPPATKMKDSGVEWLGQVPEHWEVKKFNHIFSVQEGQVDPRLEAYRNHILIAPNHIEKAKGILLAEETAAEQGADSGKYLSRIGDIIYSKIRPSLAKAIVNRIGDVLISADMYALKPRLGNNADYFLRVLLSPQFTAMAVLESDRVAMPKLNRETMAMFKLPVPPILEQQEIAESLASKLVEFDGIISKAQTGINFLVEKRSALISAAVTGKIDVRDFISQGFKSLANERLASETD